MLCMIENSCTVLNPFNRCEIHLQRRESSSEHKLSARKARAISAIFEALIDFM